jgi:hypothetical protein
MSLVGVLSLFGLNRFVLRQTIPLDDSEGWSHNVLILSQICDLSQKWIAGVDLW